MLVIAPHPDDETLGCGGLIAACVERGHRVHTIFVTDGGASHPNSRLWSRPRLAACREAEAAEALRRLGAGNEPRTFLRLEDAAMPAPGTSAHSQAVAAIAAILRTLAPRLIVLPWRRDPHCDHRASWQLTMERWPLATGLPTSSNIRSGSTSWAKSEIGRLTAKWTAFASLFQRKSSGTRSEPTAPNWAGWSQTIHWGSSSQPRQSHD